MKEEKPHLNPDLTVARLGELMNMSAENLSALLNGRLNMNFFDFANHYRVEEFKQMCQNPDNKNYSIMGMAYDCGFNSKATFNRVFKKMINQTPGEYLKQVSKK
jgi:AraC-like DNA-binding protein